MLLSLSNVMSRPVTSALAVVLICGLEMQLRSSSQLQAPQLQDMPGPYQFTVTVIYSGLKATQYFSSRSREAVNQLKEDLSSLKFPMPKSDNVIFVSHGCMSAFWIGPLNSVRDKLPILCAIKPHNL
jgi:hypothetical protein